MKYKMDLRMENVGFSIDLEFGSLRVAGDESHGFRPFQLMTASVAACSGGVLRNILKKQRIPLDDIHIEAEVTRNEKNVNRIEKIHLHFVLAGEKLNHKKVERAISLTHKNCPMVQSVIETIEVTETFEISG
jgi:uncharacterized OsmC-like protein